MKYKMIKHIVQLENLLDDLERYESDIAKHPLLVELLNCLEQCINKLGGAKPADLELGGAEDVEMPDVSRPGFGDWGWRESAADGLDRNEMLWE